MPEAMRYLPPDDPERRDILNDYMNERVKRKAAYDHARKYYDGHHTKQLDIKENEPDDNVVLNVFRMAIDRTLAFLFPAMPFLELTPMESNITPDEQWIKDAWEQNGGVVFLQKLAHNGALSGHCYVRILPPDKLHPYPRLINIDPRTIVTYWQADDIDTVVWHELLWQTGKKEYLLDVVNRAAQDGSWWLIQYERESGRAWELTKSQQWQSVYGPIVHWQHLPNANSFYGQSEAQHLELNDSINLVVSENMRINRYHSSPKTVAVGVAPGEIQETAIDELWAVENEDAEVYNLEMKSEQKFAQELAALLYDTFLAESRVVLLRGEVKDFQRVTNTGVRTVFMDALSKNIILRYQYGTGIQQVTQRMGVAAERGELLVPDVIHRDPLPVDDMELANIANIEKTMGVVSRETLSGKRGYVWQEERKRILQEQELFAPVTAPQPLDKNPNQE